MLQNTFQEIFRNFLCWSCIILLLLSGVRCGSGKRGPHHPRGCTHRVNGKTVNNVNQEETQKEHDKAYVINNDIICS